MKDLLLQVENLAIRYVMKEQVIQAVNGISFSVKKGETFGLVGETGAGKTTTVMGLMRLLSMPPAEIDTGQVLFKGENLLSYSESKMRKIRGKEMSMIFQDPMTSLNPFLKISTQMIETIRLHNKGVSKQEALQRSIEMLHLVGIPIPEKRIHNYPHQFSGGMRQRVMIAMALSCNAEVLIADEPTTALDVTIQAQILELINDLSEKMGTSVILITHDLGVVAGMCDEVCVMYAGKVVEKAETEKLYEFPAHPYTEGLIKSVPRMDTSKKGERLYSIEGQPPNVIDLPPCCPFHPRCPKAMDVCRVAYPPVTDLGGGHEVACWLYNSEEEKAAALKEAQS